jgi:hypothetical protein
MKKYLLFLSLTFSILFNSAIAATISDYSMKTYDQTIEKIYQDPTLHTHYMPQRIRIISGFFVGKPYRNGALGEGKNAPFDQNPLYRTDAFDCLTYVSTVLALSQSYSLNEFKRNILKTQYFHANPTFVNRLHFTDADWNKVNAQNGFIEDITNSFKNAEGKSVAQIAHTYINKPLWFNQLPANRLNFIYAIPPSEEKRRLDALHNLSKQVKAEEVSVPYLPLTALFNDKGEPDRFLFNQIASGSIIEIVRPNWELKKEIGTNLNISHLGFAIRTSQGLIFREASSIEHRVIDIPLIDYLKTYLNSETVKGINIQKVK